MSEISDTETMKRLGLTIGGLAAVTLFLVTISILIG